MSEKYINIFNKAFVQYQSMNETQNRKPRAGHSLSVFTTWHHSFQMYPHIQNLLNNLYGKNDEEAKALLIHYFRDPKTSYNDHSFSRFLLDVLQTDDLGNQWEQYDPTPLVFYEPTDEKPYIYRGSTQKPDEVFERGFTDLQPSKEFNDYVKPVTKDTGISTSYSYRVAEAFACNASWNVKKNDHYVYFIHLRGRKRGIDVYESLRRESKFTFDAKRMEEVNVVGRIKPKDIVKAYDVDNERFFANPNYVECRPIKNDPLPARMKKMFSKT